MSGYDIIPSEGVIKAWTRGVSVEEAARRQLRNIAELPFIHSHIAVLPDVHFGMGATVGSVIPTHKAIIPAAVGVDLGCGVMAVRTDFTARDFPNGSLPRIRAAIEEAVPHGRTHDGKSAIDRGSWREDVPDVVGETWDALAEGFDRLVERHPKLGRSNNVNHLGTLGTGNHFIEVCLDAQDRVWIMLHSGSRGVGNRIGSYFIEQAKEDMGDLLGNLPDRDLAYFLEDDADAERAQHFKDYVEAVGWAQNYALENRNLMMRAVFRALKNVVGKVRPTDEIVDCHHNYVTRETHFGEEVWVTRKGAVRAGKGEMGIIPGSMGARSYIVRGKGNPESFESCSHGAGRAMSRGDAKRQFTLTDHKKATEGVECRKDKDVIDETPAAYKPIESVMAAQADLVEVVYELRQIVCVKG